MAKPGDGWASFNRKRGSSLRSFCSLCTARELPSWHFKHRMLDSGYRYSPSFREACLSLFQLHNESVNMWTHYLASIALIAFIYYTWGTAFWNPGSIPLSRSSDLLFFITFNILGNALPIFLSAFCHQFYCVSKQWHTVCWYLDFTGILTGMLCTGATFVFSAFYCSPLLMGCVLYGMLVTYVLALQICWRRFTVRVGARVLSPVDRFPEFSRILSRFGWAATVVPVLLVLALQPEYSADPVFRDILLKAVAGPILMGLGIVCFAQGHFPERFTSWLGLRHSAFDIVGHSHQWWHVLSAALQFAWVAACCQHYQARLQHGCALPGVP